MLIEQLVTGTAFVFQGETYIKIPEMILKHSDATFIINVLRIVPSEDTHMQESYTAEYILGDTEVKFLAQ